MKQISSEINTYVKNMSIASSIEKVLFNVIIWIIGILAVTYLVFLGNMVKNIIERKALEADAKTLSTEVGDLELTYLSMSKNIDLNLSYSMGFKETQATFATRKALGMGSSTGGSFLNVKTAKNDL